MMEIKGTGVIATKVFVQENFGEDGFDRWLESLAPEAQKVYSSQVLAGSWYPLKDIVAEPVRKICDIFYGRDLKGAWEAGRFSAEYGLKGIYELFLQEGSVTHLIENGSLVIAAYYQPSPQVDIESSDRSGVLRITNYPEMCEIMELHMGGWVERALELTGCKGVSVNILQSLNRGDSCTEYEACWE